jgi:hypothetical protein
MADRGCRANPGVGLWQVKVETKDKPDFVEYQEQDLCANILVGADGENSLVAKDFEFERKVLQVLTPTHMHPRKPLLLLIG